MRKHNWVKYGLLSLALAVGAGVAVTNLGRARGQQGEPPRESYEERRAFKEALRRGGLKEAARLKGHYVGTYDPFWHRPQLDLEQLTKNSELVVVGIPVKNRGRLTRDGFTIVTVYDVTVQSVLKGDARQGEIIKVAVPGGKVMFSDGTTAEIQTPDFEKMVNGRTYALYLYEKERGGGDVSDDPRSRVYDPAAGPRGLFELSNDEGRVKSLARPTDRVALETKDKSVSAFLRDARRQVEKWPAPAKCCN